MVDFQQAVANLLCEMRNELKKIRQINETWENRETSDIAYISIPESGSTRSFSVGTTTIDFRSGIITNPDGTTEKLDISLGKLGQKWLHSLSIDADQDILLQIGSMNKRTILKNYETPLPYITFDKISIECTYATNIKIFASTNPSTSFGTFKTRSDALALFIAKYLGGSDGDYTFSSDGSFPRTMMFYDDLTINAGVTVTPASGIKTQHVFVAGTLTINGTIDFSGKGSAGGAGGGGGGNGAAGGGAIIVFANTISGSGTIRSNGNNGANGSAPTGNNNGVAGTAGAFKTVTLSAGGAGTYNLGSGGSGGTSPKSGSFTVLDFLSTILDDGYAAGGGGGAADNDSLNYGGGGAGAGGAGIWGNGGAGGSGGSDPTYTGAGGGGGGGGGLVIVLCLNSAGIPALTLQANGGNGGNGNSGASGAGGGGGGGGGFIITVAPADSSTKSVTGGTAGTAAGSGTNGTAGDVGLSLKVLYTPYDLVE